MTGLSEATQRHVIELANKRYHNTGDVDLVACPVCGWFDLLAYKHHARPERVVRVESLESVGRDCPRCQTAAQRAPEVVEWVLAAIRTARQQALE